MFGLGKWMVAGLAIWVLAAPGARAVGFQPISSDELKMTSEPLAPGAPAIILYRQVDRDDEALTPHQDNYVRIKILTEEGRKYADIEIPFLKETEEVVNVKARTVKPDGAIVDFDGKVFEKELVKANLAGREVRYLAKTFTLSEAEVGSIIEYSYRMIFNEFAVLESHWILSEELFTRKEHFSLKPLTSNPQGLSLRWSWEHLPTGTDPPKTGSDKIIRMEASNIPAFQIEDHMPPPNELKSRVDFIWEAPLSDDYWKEVGKKRNAHLERFVDKPKAMEEAVAQIVSPSDSPEAKLRKIYDRVQQIRNKSYELRKTEKEEKREKEKLAENVEDIWKHGYGTGHQLTWLFLGLVRAAGFEAYGCWVSDRKEYFFNPATKQSRKLNASVVLVKLNGKDLYFDPGGDFAPFGLLVWPETGVPGLRLDKDGGTWIQTPVPQASESQIERVGKLRLSDAGDLEGQLTLTYTGLEATYHRLEMRHADDVARKRYLERRVKSQIEAAAEVELTQQPDWTGSETPLVAEFHLKIPNWTSTAGSRVMIPAAIFTAGEKKTFEHANRVHPIYFEYPHEKWDDITVELPPGWQVSGVPAAKDQGGQVAHYVLKVDQSPGTLRLTRKLTINVRMLEQMYYSSIRNFFQEVRSADGEQIVLQPRENHASN